MKEWMSSELGIEERGNVGCVCLSAEAKTTRGKMVIFGRSDKYCI